MLHTMGTVQAKPTGASDRDVYTAGSAPAPKVKFSEEELRAKLTEEEYQVTQNKGTAPSFAIVCSLLHAAVQVLRGHGVGSMLM
jgi:hypothetical protein